MKKIAAFALCTMFAVGLVSAPILAMDYAISQHCESIDIVGNQNRCHNAWNDGRTYTGLTCIAMIMIPAAGPTLSAVCGAYVMV